MKISIIRIKPQDNLNIIIDLLKNALNTRVFLVISEGNDILYSEIGLETLFKKSLEMGKEIVLSVPNKRALEIAKNVGLVATLDQDVFTVDFKLWQKAHELLTNYKTKALYDKKFAKDPKLVADSAKEGNQATHVVKQDTKLVGTDLSNLMDNKKPKVANKASNKSNKKINIVNATGNNLISTSMHKKSGFNTKLIIGLMFFVLFILIAFGFWAYYRFFTKVYINFQIPKSTINKEYIVIAELGVEGADVANKKFALKKYETSKSGTKTAKATKKQQDGTYANGVISVTNNGTDPIEITVGQVFTSSDNKQFKATSAVTINPGETANVTVQAVDYGDAYNLAANQTFTIDGVTSSYTATNTASFSGGSQREYTVVAEEEVKKALADLKKELLEQAKTGIEDIYKDDGFVIVPDSIKDITPKDEKYSLSPKIGEEASEFTIGYKVTIRALYYHKPSLETLIRQLVVQDYKKEKKIKDNVKIKVEDFKYDIISIKVQDDKHVVFKVKAQASIVPSIDYDKLKEQIAGLELEQASNILESEYSTLVVDYRISYIPNWMPVFLQKVPKEPGRIVVVVDYVNQDQAQNKDQQDNNQKVQNK